MKAAAVCGKSAHNGKIGRHVGNVGLQPPDELLIPDPQRLIGRHAGHLGLQPRDGWRRSKGTWRPTPVRTAKSAG